jgi:hypothetical protein
MQFFTLSHPSDRLKRSEEYSFDFNIYHLGTKIYTIVIPMIRRLAEKRDLKLYKMNKILCGFNI